jgi:cyclomaltodextrinase
VTWGPWQRAPDFWPRWHRELKRVKPDLLLLAEASARDPYYGRNGFDAAYDWTDKLGEWAWQAAFEDAPNTASRSAGVAVARSPHDRDCGERTGACLCQSGREAVGQRSGDPELWRVAR